MSVSNSVNMTESFMLYELFLLIACIGHIFKQDRHLKMINNYLSTRVFNYELIKEGNGFQLSKKMNLQNENIFYYKVVFSALELITKFDLARVKCCNNPNCNWYFYDSSKNRLRKWCDNTCAALMRVRKFRSKEKSL